VENETILSGHGGWGPTSGIDPPEIAFVRTNLSVTRHALQALSETGNLTPEAREAALAYILRCRVAERDSASASGFFFSPHPDDPLNKAGYAASHQPRPYGPPTCDGIQALIACGVDLSDARIREAAYGLELPPRMDSEPEAAADAIDWREALWYYHTAALSHVATGLPSPALQKQQRESVPRLLTRQQPSGCWQNPDGKMREDDPLIATALAVSSLSAGQD